MEAGSFVKTFLTTTTLFCFLNRSTNGCAIIKDESCSAMNEHTRIFMSQVQSAATSAAAPGKRLVRVRRAPAAAAALPTRSSLLLPLVAHTSFFEHNTQKRAPGSLSFWHPLPEGLPSQPLSSSLAQRHLLLMSLSIRTSNPGSLGGEKLSLAYCHDLQNNESMCSSNKCLSFKMHMCVISNQ